MIVHAIPTINGQVPYIVSTGNTVDILELVEYRWYQWLYWRDTTGYSPKPEEQLDKVLGLSENVGSKIIQWILKENGKVICRTTLCLLTETKMASETEKAKRDKFLKAVNSKLGPTLYDICIKSDSDDFFNDSETPDFTPYVDHDGIE